MPTASFRHRLLLWFTVLIVLAVAAFGHCALPWAAHAHSATAAETHDDPAGEHDHDGLHLCDAAIARSVTTPSRLAAATDGPHVPPGVVWTGVALKSSGHFEHETLPVPKPETHPRLWLFLLYTALLI